MTVHRDGLDAPLEFTLTRELISIRSVRYRAEGPIGYIRITRFDRQTQHGLEEAIEAIKAELGDRLLGYILDLRGNPGGLVNQAVSVSDSFLEEGRIITTRGRYPSKNREYDAAPGDLADGLPMVVLINGRSASASEIVAGALHDHHRALLLGTRSYGKGTVQSTISLENHGAIRITTARYYTPSGNSIHGSGIVPDVIVEEPQNETAATTDGDEKPAKADTQLTRAIDLLCGIATFRGLENLRTHRDPPHPTMPPTMTGAAPGEGAETGRACPAQRPFVTAILPGDV
jgi:carboxyl-terminal processing protease